MAAVRAARKSTKVFYLVPQKALAEEKYEELRGRYEHVGIKVVVSSRVDSGRCIRRGGRGYAQDRREDGARGKRDRRARPSPE